MVIPPAFFPIIAKGAAACKALGAVDNLFHKTYNLFVGRAR
jgi:hypothetical protein